MVVTDDAAIHELNNQWRAKDTPTDVLSFPQFEFDELPALMDGTVAGRGLLLGDIVISADTAARQAHDADVPFPEEMMRLLVHGILHLLGHDHVHGGEQERRMKAEEKRLCAQVMQSGSR